jgi:hypothetical protein
MHALVADLQHQYRVVGHVFERVRQQVAHEVHAVFAPVERQCGFGPVFRWQRRHAGTVDVRRVAHNQVIAVGEVSPAVAVQQPDAILQAVPLNVARRYRQGIGADVAGVHLHVGPSHGGQHRQRAVARAQVEHAVRVWRQPRVELVGLRRGSDEFGDQAARHDHSLVDVKRDALQPHLTGQIGGGLAGPNTLVDQRAHGVRVRGCDRLISVRIQVEVEWQPQPPQHQPGGFVARIRGAVAKMDARLRQVLLGLIHQRSQGRGAHGVRSSTISQRPLMRCNCNVLRVRNSG